MPLETAYYPSQLNPDWPLDGDFVLQGDNHIRLIKAVILSVLGNVNGPVTVTAGELESIRDRALKAGDTYSGVHNFIGATVNVPTQPPGTGNNTAASTAFVVAQTLGSQLPGQAGQRGKVIRTDGSLAAWGDWMGPPALISANTVADKRTTYYVDTAAGAISITLPATPDPGDWVRVVDVADNAGQNGISMLRNGANIQGLAENLLIDISSAQVLLRYINSTSGWVIE